MDIYIQENGKKLSRRDKCFVISSKDNENRISAGMVDSIILEGSCSITSDAIILAVENDIPIVISDYRGKVIGRFWEHRIGGFSEIRRKQCKYLDEDPGTKIGKIWIERKIKSQVEHLEKLENRKKELNLSKEICSIEENLKKIQLLSGKSSEIREKLMGHEGIASRSYYSAIAKVIPERWKFKGREQENAQNPYNIVLNYLFGILYIKCEHALVTAGLDPYVGIFHTDGHNKKSLLFDFIEQFRFIAWETALTLFTQKKIASHLFTDNENGKEISIEGRREIAKFFHSKLDTTFITEGEKTTYNREILKEARWTAKEIIML